MGRCASLAFADNLGELKKIGMSYEPQRPVGNENVFVPQLYVVVSKGDDAPQFVEVPLLTESFNLPERPLTRSTADKVFQVNSTSYFDQVKRDYVEGRIVQGYSREEAEAEMQKKINP